MNFITILPKSEGKDAIFVVVNRLKKYAHFCSIQGTYNASQVAKVFMKYIHRLHGFIKVIICNRDPKSTINFWKELWKIIETTLAMSSTYHPHTYSQIE
jgi:hypothetical protein